MLGVTDDALRDEDGRIYSWRPRSIMQTAAPPTTLGATVELAEQRVDEHWRQAATTRSAERVLVIVVVVVVGRSVAHDRRMVDRCSIAVA